MKREKNISLILANLTVREYERVQKAKVGFSGSTGAHADLDSYGEYAPYIASFTSEIVHAIKALRWTHFTVTAGAHQWILRKS